MRLDARNPPDTGAAYAGAAAARGDSPAALRKAAEAVDGALPDSRIVVVAGQGHAAMDIATGLFTAEVLRFLTADTQQVSPKARGATWRTG